MFDNIYSLIYVPFIIVRRMSLSDIALLDDCLLVYCVIEWQKCVFMCMHVS